MVVLVSGAALAGCAPPPPPVVTQAAPPPSVDGRYRGTARLISADRRGCPRSGARVLEVTGNAVTMTYVAQPREIGQLTAKIAPDGSFQASDGVGSLDGTVRDGRLEATITSTMCVNHWSLTKVS